AGCEAVKAYLADHCDMLLELYEAAEKAALRQQVAKSLRALGVEFEERPEDRKDAGGGAPSNGGPGAHPEPVVNLLDLYDAPAPAPASTAAGGIFSTLDVKAPVAGSPVPVAAASSASVSGSSGSSGGAAGMADMFGNLSMGGASAVARAPP